MQMKASRGSIASEAHSTIITVCCIQLHTANFSSSCIIQPLNLFHEYLKAKGSFMRLLLRHTNKTAVCRHLREINFAPLPLLLLFQENSVFCMVKAEEKLLNYHYVMCRLGKLYHIFVSLCTSQKFNVYTFRILSCGRFRLSLVVESGERSCDSFPLLISHFLFYDLLIGSATC
jgi:hypothetical protein